MYQKLMGRRLYLIMTLFCVAVVLGVSGCAGQKLAPGMSMVKGKARSINVEQATLRVVPPRGERVLVSVDGNTEFKGFETLLSIKKGDPVEVIYMNNGKANIAISIKKIALGSC